MAEAEAEHELMLREQRRLERSMMKRAQGGGSRISAAKSPAKAMVGATAATVVQAPKAAEAAAAAKPASAKKGGWKEKQAKIEAERKAHEAQRQKDLEEQRRRDEEERAERQRFRGRKELWEMLDDEIFAAADFADAASAANALSAGVAGASTVSAASTATSSNLPRSASPAAAATATATATAKASSSGSKSDSAAGSSSRATDASAELDALLSVASKPAVRPASSATSTSKPSSSSSTFSPSSSSSSSASPSPAAAASAGGGESVEDLLGELERTAQRQQSQTEVVRARREQEEAARRREQEEAARRREQEETERRRLAELEKRRREQEAEERRRAEEAERRRLAEQAEREANDERALQQMSSEDRATAVLNLLVGDTKHMVGVLEHFDSSKLEQFLADVQRINKRVSDFGKSFFAPVTDNTTQELVDATLQFMKVAMNLIQVTKQTPRDQQISGDASSPFAFAKEAVREQLVCMLRIVVQAKGKAAEYRVEHERRQQRQSLAVAVRRTGEISLALTNCMDAAYLNRSEFNGHLAEITKCIRDSIQSEEVREQLLPLVKELLNNGKLFRDDQNDMTRISFTTSISALINALMEMIQ
eukprot:CAMPEP_0177679732 /NCGR_PEP_ID=MMETSP0447-20121125/29766_1 /TAXON_ID=0 /ORGANISM="Stygamoeba regulata, Strain BSH-02190019" /LENGTH=596 /DNA_ID=CAMNT_0019188955 /DNA_START=76 /DNA_END=1866 /DNA_ORIENTATION=+